VKAKLLGFIKVHFNVTDQIYCIHQILEKKWECNGTVHQLFIEFETEYDSVKREGMYSILTGYNRPVKKVNLIKMYLNETYSNVRIGKKNVCDAFPIPNDPKQDDLVPLLSNFSLEYAIRKVQESREGMELNGTHRPLVYADTFAVTLINPVKNKYHKEKQKSSVTGK
jgi:hypothetical protein